MSLSKPALLILWTSVVVCAAGCSRPQPTNLRANAELSFSTADGWDLHATLYPSDHQNSPALILVHMLGSNRQAWTAFATRAQQAGYTCLAFDMRGHGESTDQGGTDHSYRKFSAEDWQAATADIEAAKLELLGHGVDPQNIAVVGASIGANLALQYAHDHSDIQAAVLLSPGLDYRSVQTESIIAEIKEVPVLLMAAEGDSYAAASSTTLNKMAPGFSQLHTYPGSAHGTDLLAASRSATDQIFQWLDSILTTQPESPAK